MLRGASGSSRRPGFFSLALPAPARRQSRRCSPPRPAAPSIRSRAQT
jgi:hypothetical protein